MGSTPSKLEVAAVLAAAALAVVGASRPWVRKRPAGFVGGDPVYTMEYVTGLDGGFQSVDAYVLVPALVASAVVVSGRLHGWRPGRILAVASAPILLTAGRLFLGYDESPHYAPLPGLLVVVGVGIVFLCVGARSHFVRKRGS